MRKYIIVLTSLLILQNIGGKLVMTAQDDELPPIITAENATMLRTTAILGGGEGTWSSDGNMLASTTLKALDGFGGWILT